MINVKPIRVGEKTVMGVRVDLPTAPLLLIVGERGFVGCAYISGETGEKLGDAVAIVSGVQSFEDVLEAKVIRVTEEAASMGVSTGMTGREALAVLA